MEGMEPVNEERAERTPVRERLMDAAYAEVVAGRWTQQRMADIASAAEVSRQTLYNVFGSKEGLLQAVVVREADSLLDKVVALLEEDRSDPVHAVSRTTGFVLRSLRDNPLLRAVVAGDRELLPVVTTRSAPLLDVLGERMAAMLAESCPELDRSVTEAVADVNLRLTVSYALQPIDPDEAARRVEAVVHGMLCVGLPEAGRTRG